MPYVLQGVSPEIKARLEQPLQPNGSQISFTTVQGMLDLNPQVNLGDLFPGETGEQVLLSAAVDEPDQGIDRDLPDPSDPKGDRAWMGGKQGPTSQGFRHMYFGGWFPLHPITTLQIPLHEIGQAPERVKSISEQARALLMRPETSRWGYRLLAWALHYVQDLGQPFHSVQVVSFGMLPWSSLFTGEFVRESTRVITNYHYAFERYIEGYVEERTDPLFTDCLTNADAHSNVASLHPSIPSESRQIAYWVSEGSIKAASRFGNAELALFGDTMKNPGVSLAHEQGEPDFVGIRQNPALVSQRRSMADATCPAIANAIWASRRLIEWTFKP